MRGALIAFSAVGVLLAGSALAQQRTGLPPVQGGAERPGLPAVNSKPAAVDPDADQKRTLAAFSNWNRAQGRPRMLVYWNRQLDDETTTRYRDVTTTGAAVVAGRNVAVGGAVTVKEQERTTGGLYAEMWSDGGVIQNGYFGTLLNAGANVIDRAALMRKVSTKKDAADRSDQQFIESLALEQGIDYLVEILPQTDAGSPTGYAFTVKITHLPTSSIRGQFRTIALPTAGPKKWVAGTGGFYREQDSRVTADNIARTLASETLGAFTR